MNFALNGELPQEMEYYIFRIENFCRWNNRDR